MFPELSPDTTAFPPVESTNITGVIAMGGDLSVERLIAAYQSGIFPWYDRPPLLWWYPDPRFVLFPNRLFISKSMKQVLKKRLFTFTYNQEFEQVISLCRRIKRKNQPGTWIHQEIINAYTQLYRRGYAVSVEAWQDGRLVGGLYGVRMGNIFFGESMFSLVSNASKAAFIHFVEKLKQEHVSLIDCQMYTAHLASLGAELIPDASFTRVLKDGINR